MIFHSLDFVLFFLGFTAIYWWLPHRLQNIFLLAGSYFFYGYIHPWFLILIATSTIIDYCAARGMEARPGRDAAGQFRLDVHVDILQRRVPLEPAG